MFARVTVRASDPAASQRFYETVLPTLGLDRSDRSDFALEPADAEHPATRGLHIGFVAASRAEVDEFWRVGTSAGYDDDGAPGPRPQYREDYYGAFLLDPDGNSVEAVHHGELRQGGVVDHLWIRVADVPAAKSFYAAVAPNGGFKLAADRPDYARFDGDSGSFSVLSGTPTANAHIAFPAVGEPVERALGPHGNSVEVVPRA